MATPYVVTIMGDLNGELDMNQLTFLSESDDPTTTNAYGLLQALGFQPLDTSEPVPGSVLGTLLEAQTVRYSMEEIQVRSLTSVIDFITQPVSPVQWAGRIAVPTGDGALNFSAARLRTNRVRTDIRRGTLSLSGGTEEQIEGQDNWTAGYLDLLSDVCTALNAVKSYTVGGVTTVFRNAVFQKEKYVSRPGGMDLSPRYAYRYYTDEEEFISHTAVGVTWSPVQRVSSQNSRKFGRGA